MRSSDWRAVLSWLFFVVAALWLAYAIYDVVAGRSFAFPLVVAVLFGVLGALWRILRSRSPRL